MKILLSLLQWTDLRARVAVLMISALAVLSLLESSSRSCLAQSSPLTRVDSTSASNPSNAQGGASGEDADHTLETHRNEFGVWAGGSFGLPSSIPGSRDRSIPALVAVRYGRVLFAGTAAALEYTLDLVPVAVVSGPAGLPEVPPPGSTGRERVYGAGFAPLGFKLFLAPEHRLKPYITASSGAFYFAKQFPVPNSAQFNFLSTGGGGVQFFITPTKAISAEYRIGHLSNANIGKLNPGFNSSVILIGFSIFK